MGQFTSMMRVIGGLGLGCSLALALAACSSGDDDSSQGGAGTMNQGGTSDAGSAQGGAAAGKGGNASAGSSSTAGSGGHGGGSAGTNGGTGGASAGAPAGGSSGMPGGQCSPGTLSRVDDAQGPINKCKNYDPYLIKQPVGTKLFVYDVLLDPVPVEDGTTALSAQFSDGKHPKMEVWNADMECASAAQQMGTATAGPGAACIQRTSATPRQHLLLVLFEDAPLEQVTACPSGTCP